MARNKSNRVDRVSKSSSFRRLISASDLKGPKQVPRLIVVKDFYGPGEDGSIYFLPLPLNLSWKIKTDVDPGEMGKILADQLSRSIVDSDGNPVMSMDDWGEMSLERLLDVSSKLMKSVSEESSEPSEGNA